MLAKVLCCLVLLSLFTPGAANTATDPTTCDFSIRVRHHQTQRSCILLSVSREFGTDLSVRFRSTKEI